MKAYTYLNAECDEIIILLYNDDVELIIDDEDVELIFEDDENDTALSTSVETTFNSSKITQMIYDDQFIDSLMKVNACYTTTKMDEPIRYEENVHDTTIHKYFMIVEYVFQYGIQYMYIRLNLI